MSSEIFAVIGCKAGVEDDVLLNRKEANKFLKKNQCTSLWKVNKEHLLSAVRKSEWDVDVIKLSIMKLN